MNNLSTLSTALAVLSAMIAPVVLISACASLAISTSARLARTIDRTRKLLDRFEVVAPKVNDDAALKDEMLFLYEQLGHSTRRSKLLHLSMTGLYVALTIFVATSIALGFVSIADEQYAWMPLLLGMIGAIALFYTCILLIRETRITRTAINDEMSFVLRRTHVHASPEVLKQLQEHRRTLLSENMS